MTTPNPKYGEIWLVEFDPARGSEIQKTRPALVVSADNIGKLPLHIVAPITDWKPIYTTFPWFVPLKPNSTNGLSKDSGIDTFQVKSLSRDRFRRKLGRVSNADLIETRQGILLCLGQPRNV